MVFQNVVIARNHKVIASPINSACQITYPQIFSEFCLSGSLTGRSVGLLTAVLTQKGPVKQKGGTHTSMCASFAYMRPSYIVVYSSYFRNTQSSCKKLLLSFSDKYRWVSDLFSIWKKFHKYKRKNGQIYRKKYAWLMVMRTPSKIENFSLPVSYLKTITAICHKNIIFFEVRKNRRRCKRVTCKQRRYT